MYKLVKYMQVAALNKESLLTALSKGCCILCGIPVDQDFMNFNSQNYTLTPKNATGNQLGGYANYAYGYNLTGLLCRNSWNIKWGQDGNYIMGWDFALKYLMNVWGPSRLALSCSFRESFRNIGKNLSRPSYAMTEDSNTRTSSTSS